MPAKSTAFGSMNNNSRRRCCLPWHFLWQHVRAEQINLECLVTFISQEFLLHSKAAQRLYHNYAESEPILDFHSHLSAADIAQDRRFCDLSEILLQSGPFKMVVVPGEGDSEPPFTGDPPPFQTFLTLAPSVPLHPPNT